MKNRIFPLVFDNFLQLSLDEDLEEGAPHALDQKKFALAERLSDLDSHVTQIKIADQEGVIDPKILPIFRQVAQFADSSDQPKETALSVFRMACDYMTAILGEEEEIIISEGATIEPLKALQGICDCYCELHYPQ